MSLQYPELKQAFVVFCFHIGRLLPVLFEDLKYEVTLSLGIGPKALGLSPIGAPTGGLSKQCE